MYEHYSFNHSLSLVCSSCSRRAKIDPTFSAILDINDIQENVRTHLTHFIEHQKDLEEGKYVKLLGWEEKMLRK
jgi:inorganic pyrophosphatase